MPSSRLSAFLQVFISHVSPICTMRKIFEDSQETEWPKTYQILSHDLSGHQTFHDSSSNISRSSNAINNAQPMLTFAVVETTESYGITTATTATLLNLVHKTKEFTHIRIYTRLKGCWLPEIIKTLTSLGSQIT